MEISPVAIIVDDLPGQMAGLRQTTERVLTEAALQVDRQWHIESASSEAEALELFSKVGDRVRIVVSDLYLSHPPKQIPEGPRLLQQARIASERCFTILVSRIAQSRKAINDVLSRTDRATIDKIVSLRYIDTDPVTELRNAVVEGRDRYERSL